MTIVTQTEDLVNYDTVKKISLASGTVKDKATGEDITVYVILAFDVLSEIDANEYEDAAIQLGAYHSESKCRDVFDQLIGCISTNANLFIIPQPD